MNHSCNPNCATQKWIVSGRLRIGLFTLRRIKANTELTFDYKFIRFGASAQKCLCGEESCKGVIGEEQKESRPVAVKKPTSQQEEDDTNMARERFTGELGVENSDDMALLARLLLRTEDLEAVNPLIWTLTLTDDPVLLKRFVSLHGLQIINVLLGSHWRDLKIVSAMVSILSKLPVTSRNSLEDAHIEDKIARLIQRDDLSKETIEAAKSLVEKWALLEHVFRIPKVTVEEPKAIPAAPAAGYSLLEDGARFKKSKWTVPSGKSASPPLSSYSSTGWRKARAPDGRTYYYHEQTRETRWYLPSGHQTTFDSTHARENQFYEKRDHREYDKERHNNKSADPKPLDQEMRLKEIIERAKSAALARNSFAIESDNDKTVSGDGLRWRQFDSQLCERISHIVVKYMSRWCRDQILSPAVFKETARKLTHRITEKELRAIKKECNIPPSDTSESELISSQKKAKIKTYLAQYLRDHGYRVEDDSAVTPSTQSSSVAPPS